MMTQIGLRKRNQGHTSPTALGNIEPQPHAKDLEILKNKKMERLQLISWTVVMFGGTGQKWILCPVCRHKPRATVPVTDARLHMQHMQLPSVVGPKPSLLFSK